MLATLATKLPLQRSLIKSSSHSVPENNLDQFKKNLGTKPEKNNVRKGVKLCFNFATPDQIWSCVPNWPATSGVRKIVTPRLNTGAINQGWPLARRTFHKKGVWQCFLRCQGNEDLETVIRTKFDELTRTGCCQKEKVFDIGTGTDKKGGITEILTDNLPKEIRLKMSN